MVQILYVLECEQKRFYIGAAERRRAVKELVQHREGKHAAKWTRKYKGLTLLSTVLLAYPEQTTIETERLMQIKGIQNVRGGDYNDIQLTPFQLRRIKRKFKWKTNACRKCGRTSHIITNCKAKTFVNGEMFSDDEDSDNESAQSSTSSYSYSATKVDKRPTPGMTWHSIPP